MARGCRELGLTIKELTFHLTGTPSSYTSIFLPSYTRALAATCHRDPEELLISHTPFPYLVSFMSVAERDRLTDLVLSRTGIEGRSFNSLTQTVSDAVPRRRRCPDCLLEDLRLYGTSYWHRQHHLPANHYCLKHQSPLEETDVPIRSQIRNWSYLMPHEVRGAPPALNTASSTLLTIARKSSDYLLAKSNGEAHWRGFYRDIAMKKGYIVCASQAAGRQLSEDLRIHYGDELLHGARCSIPLSRKRLWPGLMIQPRAQVPFSPVKHILLQAFLDKCPSVETIQRNKPGPRTRVPESVDGEIVSALTAEINQFPDILESLTVKELLERVRCFGAWRHRRQLLPRTAKLLAELKTLRRRLASS